MLDVLDPFVNYTDVFIANADLLLNTGEGMSDRCTLLLLVLSLLAGHVLLTHLVTDQLSFVL